MTQIAILEDLPRALEGKSGWPWTEQSKAQSRPHETRRKWPKITIVTPSYNQGTYIEETIRSVLLQGYPRLEYIIVDGGSNDKTLAILKKYSNWISAWSSEPDEGQSHALNKGFEKASGEIFGFVNSDDLLEKDALYSVARCYGRNGEPPLVVGDCLIFGASSTDRLFDKWWPKNMDHYLQPFGNTLPQPSCFWKKDLYERVGGFDSSLHYAFDQEFFLKIGLEGIRPHFMEKTLSRYRDHFETKSRDTVKFYEESIPIIEKFGPKCGLSESQIRRRIRRVRNDISYFQAFKIWKRSGRRAAAMFFMAWTLSHPDFLLDRKVLGLARRLIMFPESEVAELAN